MGIRTSHRGRGQVVEHGIGVLLNGRLAGVEQDLALGEDVGKPRLAFSGRERRGGRGDPDRSRRAVIMRRGGGEFSRNVGRRLGVERITFDADACVGHRGDA